MHPKPSECHAYIFSNSVLFLGFLPENTPQRLKDLLHQIFRPSDLRLFALLLQIGSKPDRFFLQSKNRNELLFFFVLFLFQLKLHCGAAASPIFPSPAVAFRSDWSCCCCVARRRRRPSVSQAPLHIILSCHFLLAASLLPLLLLLLEKLLQKSRRNLAHVRIQN